MAEPGQATDALVEQMAVALWNERVRGGRGYEWSPYYPDEGSKLHSRASARAALDVARPLLRAEAAAEQREVDVALVTNAWWYHTSEENPSVHRVLGSLRREMTNAPLVTDSEEKSNG